jgi:hypothetical protein
LTDDENFSSDPVHAAGGFGELISRRRGEVPMGMAPILGNSDDPDHGRLRTIVNRSFTPRVIAELRPSIERGVAALLEPLPTGEPFEAMSALCEPLAVTTILDHLGVPREGWGQVRQWSGAIMRARAEGNSTPGVVEAALAARTHMHDYLAAAFAEGKLAERASVLRTLLEAARVEGLAADQWLMLLIHISLAGNGPTALGLANMLLTLARFPAARAALIADPAGIPTAIEELLRFETPTHMVLRWARTDTTLGDRTIRAGQSLHAVIASANRDPAQFPDPDVLDIARRENRHLSFGVGVHFCLGAPVARLEFELALGAFLAKFGEYEIGAIDRGDTLQLRGPRRLFIRGAHPRA